MSQQSLIKAQRQGQSWMPIAGGVLQRNCEKCGKKKRALQRAAIHPAPYSVPPIVQEVLRSPGQPLDPATRSFMEPRFGYDFSHVQVHTDSRAAESARAVSALAYTVGNHIAFNANLHRPYSIEGRQLIAHELAHVVQQSRSITEDPLAIESNFENEAHHAASVAANGDVQNVSLTGHRISLQRQPRSGQQAPVQPALPNARQQRIIDAARRSAAIRCQIAMFRVGGIVPPGPERRIDPSIEWRRRARSLAQVMFEWENPNMEQIQDVISSMVNFLTLGVQIMIAPNNDPECGTRAAYVRGLRPPVILCPTFFNNSPEQQARTMIHEAAHLARIGGADLGESYCVDFDCVTSCGGFDSADSWAHFVHCLSGQVPDQPTVIQGNVPAGGQSQVPQRGSGGRQ
jgi:hypothetical protein